MEKREFMAVFQLSKMRMFEVHYYTLGGNKAPYFSTTAEEFIKSKRDYSMCGQCQPYVLKEFRTARQFFEKWDPYHVHDLTEEQYAEMVSDLDALKHKYNYILLELNESRKPYNPRISFYDIVRLSKLTPNTGYAEIQRR